jgi:AAA+ ATPase superfamily predicted ATPase
MKFFDREKEIEKLRDIRARAREGACWTILTGRRRVGKTALVTTAFGDEPYLYLFVTRSAEADLCDGFKSRKY